MKWARALAVVFIAVASSCAQTGTTSVRGTVLDKSGAAVAGAKVSITNNGQALNRETQTDNSGEYRFLALPPGNYDLTVEKKVFASFNKPAWIFWSMSRIPAM
jgi:protocatechuate 3,4-dioxygenase beta subunit